MADGRSRRGGKPRKKKKSMRGPLVIGGLGFAAMMLMVIVLGQSGRKNREVVTSPVVPPANYVPPAPRPTSSDEPEIDASGYELVDNPAHAAGRCRRPPARRRWK